MQVSGKIAWTTLRDAIDAADTAHPNATPPTDALQTPVLRSRDAWLRLTNGVTVTDPSLTVTVYGRQTSGVWTRLGQMNGGTAIAPTTGQGLEEAARVNHAELFTGLGAWDEIWASVTGTFGDDGGGPPEPGTATVQLGWEVP